ncbi:MAG: glycosyltransferase family 9 protein [Saprospiraceae bacterium]|nr:glycosyltransferase family 9 protein [Saprospiraceae bacterium]MCF8249349.1 glycosyltransferase family 9 protein [Saprospiraceae bacterium]MCF8311374.1 glycosyltransferase family 9 protein [Saprospiraceae bacterium]MCF8439968.1 glycosyltransferase family 9 protein [Saprospiraceae bacterium]
MASFKKILLIQTAFIGDVVLATALVEKLAEYYPQANIDFLLRKGNEGLLENHLHITKVLVWDKKNSKYTNLLRLLRQIRKEKYDLVVNLQRFLATGLLTTFSKAKIRVCFDKNPLSMFANHVIKHQIGNDNYAIHEVERNLVLIAKWTDNQFVSPKIYPSKSDFAAVFSDEKYLTISPASVWFTKQFPKERWLELMDKVGEDASIFLLGGPGDFEVCNWLKTKTKHQKTVVMAGKLSFLESAALMKNAVMNYVNDSGPLHFASGVNAPVTAIFCSTVLSFGFGPLSTDSVVIETKEKLTCRPCGLHGRNICPEGHFRCAKIDVERLLERIPR